jgi:hypothetical protein
MENSSNASWQGSFIPPTSKISIKAANNSKVEVQFILAFNETFYKLFTPLGKTTEKWI